jgi:hypothetical protein
MWRIAGEAESAVCVTVLAEANGSACSKEVTRLSPRGLLEGGDSPRALVSLEPHLS